MPKITTFRPEISSHRPKIMGEGTEKEEEKIPHMCESIGHRPLWSRWQKVGNANFPWNIDGKIFKNAKFQLDNIEI